MIKSNIVIVGGGACGLLLSILLAKNNKNITLLEKNSTLAKKIRVSGNGRCNITNKNIQLKNYHIGNKKLIKSLISNFNYQHIKKLFSSLGIEFKEMSDGRVFPLSLNSQSVIDILKTHADYFNIDIKLNSEVVDIKKDKIFQIKTKDRTFIANKVIVCTGSNAYKNIGVSDISYNIGRKFGHRVHSLYPSLVQVESSDKRVHRASGVKLDSYIKTIVDGKVVCKKRGDLLFTNYGLSGLAILDSSYYISKAFHEQKRVILEIDLLPFISLDDLKEMLRKREKLKSILDFESWIEGIIDKKIIPLLVKDSIINKKNINQIAHSIKSLKIEVDGVRDAKYAEIIAGGIDTNELKGSLESKKIDNLFFGGEALDICGDRGGYNLHLAFACAYRISVSI